MKAVALRQSELWAKQGRHLYSNLLSEQHLNFRMSEAFMKNRLENIRNYVDTINL